MRHSQTMVAVVGFMIVCGIIFFSPKTQVEVVRSAPSEPTTPLITQNPTYPVKISIESIGVYAPVESVGILSEAMAVPTSGNNVGWYSLGAQPGDIGTAVLAGHVNWMNGEDAVFTHLDSIQIDDIVSITNNYGYTNSFIVRKIKNYPFNSDTREIFSSTDGLSHLNLITCTGTWNKRLGTHNSRLVIFTEKITLN